MPEAYVAFRSSKSGIIGRVAHPPQGYRFTRFLAVIMSDGVDFDFTENIAPAWRVMFGDGDLDLESDWFPILGGKDTLFGYGVVGQNLEWLARSRHLLDCGVPPSTGSHGS